jgi:hypothetical protein
MFKAAHNRGEGGASFWPRSLGGERIVNLGKNAT